MHFWERLLLLLMIQAAGLFCQHSIWKCTKEVSNCPITEELWYKRWKDFPCFGVGLNYTCMKAAGGVLVEACINEYDIRVFTGSRCPFIHSCDGIEPVLAIEGNWPLCPEDVFGCPPADHPVYTVYHMYKYPACIVRNISELLTTTVPEEIVSSPTVVVINITKNDHSNRRGNNNDILGIVAGVTIGFVFVLLSIIVFCVWKVVRRRKVRRKKNDNDIKCCDYPQGTYEGSTPLLIDSGNSIPLTEETNLKRPCHSETEEEIVHLIPGKGHAIPLTKEINLKRPCDSETEEETVHLRPAQGHSIPLTEETTLKRPYIPCDSETEEVTANVIPNQCKRAHSILLTGDTNLKRPYIPCDSETKEETVHVTPYQGFHEDFKERLLKFSKNVTEKIPMSPVQASPNHPVNLLYAQVVIKTDARYVQMGYQYYEDTNLEKETKYIEKPTDLFYKYGKLTERIFMIGNAAHGKTTYCMWLLQHWYHAHSKRTRTQDEWGKEIGNFDFVFLVRLRNVQKSRGNVIDMICKDILGINDEGNINWLKNALRSGNYRSLILIDGLDEWKPTDDNKFKGIPNTDDIKNCVIFISMRPWKFEEVSKDVNSEDRVIEILGLNEKGLRKVTENVLFSHFGLNIEQREGKLKYDTILNKIKNKTLASIMKIPLLAVLCVQMWYEGDELTNSLTRFYSAMINMLIERTEEKNTTASNLDYSQNISISYNNYEPLLLKLGKLAYEGLMAGRYIYEVCTKTMLEQIGLTTSELDFSLNVGLLSKEETDCVMTKKVKVYFFHASVQEYLGAVYIDQNEEIRNSFCDQLLSVKDILQFGNVLVFLTGLNAQLGSEISKRIVYVANNDNEVSRYRKFDAGVLYINGKLLYNLQASCYRELICTQSCTDPSKQVIPYHVSDVYVDNKSDIETIRATADILTYHHTEIKSIGMFIVPNDVENGIPDSLLTQYLDHTVSLQSLYINGYNTDRTFHHISEIFSKLTTLILSNIAFTPEAFSTLQTEIQSNTVIQTLGLVNIRIQINQNESSKPASLSGIIQILPDLPRLTELRIEIANKDDKLVFHNVLSRLSHLHGIRYLGTSPSDEYDHDVVHTVCAWSGLRWLHLFYVNLGDRGLQLPHHMLHLETVVLWRVDMLPSAWNRFIESMLNINHQFEIILREVNTDKKCLTLARSSSQFRITRDKVADYGRHNLHFTRIFPPSE